MLNKTKAAPHGRQSYNVLLKRIQDTNPTAGGQNQPFGSMPDLRSFSRQASLTHELKFPVPAVSLICSRRASSKRMFFIVLPERSNLCLELLSCIGRYRSCKLDLNGTYRLLRKQHKTAKPGSGGTLTGPLTTSDS